MLVFTLFILLILLLILIISILDYSKDRKSYKLLFITICLILLYWGLEIIINHHY